MAGALLALAACARNGQPGFAPMPEARRGQIELDPQEATKKLAEAMTAAGLPVTDVATREGFVSTAWFDASDLKATGAGRVGPSTVRIRAWVMPWRYGWSEITMEAVYRPVADPSLPERELERSVPYNHPARGRIRDIMQQMGVTSTLAESDSLVPDAGRPTMDPGAKKKRVLGIPKSGRPAAAAPADSIVSPSDSVAPPNDSVPPRRDSAIVFRPATPGDTVHQPAPPAQPQPEPRPSPPPPPTPAPVAPVASADTVHPAPVTTGYAVQVAAPDGAYAANEFATRLKQLGYDARVVTEDGRYKVRTQLYKNRTDAAIALERLRGTFRDAFVVRE
jgi:hypothetical protein